MFLVSLLATAASAETLAPPRFPVQANGVTPGGLLFTAANEKLVMRDESGGLRATYAAAREEFVVLGMEDDGRRVTSRTRYPIGRGSSGSEVAASYTFRSSDGSILTKRRVVSQGAAPVPFGAAVYGLGKNGRALTVQRTSASEEGVPVFTLEGPIATRALGKPSGMALHVSAAGLVLERRFSSGALYAFALPAGKVAEVKYQKSECDAEMLDVYPSAGRLTFVTREYDGRRSVLEGFALSPAGETVLRRDLGAFDGATGVHPLEAGGLLIVSRLEAVIFDSELRESGRFALSTDPTVAAGTVERTRALARRLSELGEKATGADWADLALLPEAPLDAFRAVLARDPGGALDRLAKAQNSELTVAETNLAPWTGFIVQKATAGSRAKKAGKPAPASPLLTKIAGLPLRLRNLFAPALLEALGKDAPGWTGPAAAEAFTKGSPGAERAFLSHVPPALVETVLALDRARLDASKEVPEGRWDGFHVPAEGNEDTLLACLAGGAAPRVSAVVAALDPDSLDMAEYLSGSYGLNEEREKELVEVRGRQLERRATMAARLARLGPLSSLRDPAERAGVAALWALHELPLSEAAFRESLLAEASPLPFDIALSALATEPSLPAETVAGLAVELFLAARQRSRDPGACLSFLNPGAEESGDGGPDETDPYCKTLGTYLGIVSRGTPRSLRLAGLGERTRLLPEMAVVSTLERVAGGRASQEEILGVFRNRELSFEVRRMVLDSSVYTAPTPALARFLESELEAGGLSSEEESFLAGALRRVDSAAAGRRAAARIPGKDASSEVLEGWLAAVPDESVANEKVREKLGALLENDELWPDAVKKLAPTGDPAAFPHLVLAVKTGCLRCIGKEGLVKLFSPYGAEGFRALEDICRTVPDADMAAAGLEALETDTPARAWALAEERLSKSLTESCVPGALVDLLARWNRDPYTSVARRLSELSCERSRLKPRHPLSPGVSPGEKGEDDLEFDPDDEDTEEAALAVANKRLAATPAGRAAVRLGRGPCRDAFEALFGLRPK